MNKRWRSLWVVALGALAPAVASAQTETWFGASAEVTAGYLDPGGADTFVSTTQLEGAFLLTSGALTVDIQLDFFVDNAEGAIIENPPADWAATRYVRPEYALVEVDLGGPFVRAGIVNTAFGLEDWDSWKNPLPTYSNYYTFLSPGRLLGGEVGLAFGEASDVTVHGGYDLEWEAVRVGAAVGHEAEGWSTYSGVAVYPETEFYEVILGGNIVPMDLLTIAYDGSAGLIEGSAFVVGDLTFIALPDGMINPALRVEGTFDPDAVTGAPDATLGLGATAWPLEFLRIAVEANAEFVADEVVPGVFASLSVHSPGPPEE
jgi:hypothetical protein